MSTETRPVRDRAAARERKAAAPVPLGLEKYAAALDEPEFAPGLATELWDLLLADNEGSAGAMEWVWGLSLAAKKKFIRAVDAELSPRYPMIAGFSENWPRTQSVPPYIRDPEVRSHDFELVNQGYLGYTEIGYSHREVDLLVWLETLRDLQCAQAPCELGKLIKATGKRMGGCPVQVHIPDMIRLIGMGRYREAMEIIEKVNPLPNVTGRVCPQELQCQSVCTHGNAPIEIGQIEWFLPQRDKQLSPDSFASRYADIINPWDAATKPPIAIVGSGPSGLINAFLLAHDGYPVTVFEAFHELGGVLRYGIPEFRLPNSLIDDVVNKILLLGGRFVTNFVVGKTATLDQLRDAGFAGIFVGSGAGLPRFMNVPGEHLLNIMSANEFLTRVNLMQGHRDGFETPLPATEGKKVLVIGGGNTAMDAARTARRLGGDVTIVYRRTREEMPARVEELHHALEEGIELLPLRSPSEFIGNEQHFVTSAMLDVIELGEPDASGRRSPVATGRTDVIEADLVIMALGNSPNPLIKDSEPRLEVSSWGSFALTEGQQTSLPGVYSGGDATRGGSTAVHAAGDGQAAARQILNEITLPDDAIADAVERALAFTNAATAPNRIVAKRVLSPGIVEFDVHAPVIAHSAQAGQFVRVLPTPNGELIPLTLADWDAETGTITLVIQNMGASSALMNETEVGEAFAGVAGPLGQASHLQRYPDDQRVVFVAGGLGLPPAYPIVREHLRLGNQVILIAGFRNADLLFWVGEGERVDALQAEFGDQLQVIYTSNDGSFGIEGLVTVPLEQLLIAARDGVGPVIAEVTAIGPPLMMNAVAQMTRPFGVRTVASLNSIMVDATGMCGACMVPVVDGEKIIRKHACIDGPELDAHTIDWAKFLPRFNQFRAQEAVSKERHGLS